MFLLTLTVSCQYSSGTDFNFFPPSSPQLLLDSRQPFHLVAVTCKVQLHETEDSLLLLKCGNFLSLSPTGRIWLKWKDLYQEERDTACGAPRTCCCWLVGLFVQNTGQRRSIDQSNKVTEGLAYTTKRLSNEQSGREQPQGLYNPSCEEE